MMVNKVKITLYVTKKGVSEVMPTSRQGFIAFRHRFRHPDAEIEIWRTASASPAKMYDQVRHGVMLAVQAAGLSVSALKDESRKPPRTKKVSPKQQGLL